MNVAFMKLNGLATGGTETWLQLLARSMAERGHSVAFFVGSGEVQIPESVGRRKELEVAGVRVIDFTCEGSVSEGEWAETDLWEVFHAGDFDVVQTAKAGPAEYPYTNMKIPVVECVCLLAGVDRSPSIAWSIHLSEWQRARWIRAGGSPLRSSVIPIPIDDRQIASLIDLRGEMGLSSDSVLVGLHQRNDDRIFSPIPLDAFASTRHAAAAFILLGGGERYREQAEQLQDSRIHFMDHAADKSVVLGFLNDLDIFAHGRGDGETFGGAIAEAMAAGLPVLSHRSVRGANAHRDTIAAAGLWANNASEYQRHLHRLLMKPDLRATLGRRGIDHTKHFFGLELAVLNLEATYSRVLDDMRKPMLSYGRTRWGYLQAGDTTDPAELAFQVPSEGAAELSDVTVMTALTRPGDMIVDVGANAGLYGCVAAQNGRYVIAFEPDPSYASQLRDTVALNGWESSLIVNERALGSSVGTVDLHPAGTGSTLLPEFAGPEALGPPFTVSMSTLDDELRDSEQVLQFLKIDVEGSELQVLSGAAGVITRDRPHILIEIAARRPETGLVNEQLAETVDWLNDAGYTIFHLGGVGGLRVVRDIPTIDGAQNYLAVAGSAVVARQLMVRSKFLANAALAGYLAQRLLHKIDPYEEMRRSPISYARGSTKALRRLVKSRFR